LVLCNLFPPPSLNLSFFLSGSFYNFLLSSIFLNINLIYIQVYVFRYLSSFSSLWIHSIWGLLSLLIWTLVPQILPLFHLWLFSRSTFGFYILASIFSVFK
jgi:hypothetical protein